MTTINWWVAWRWWSDDLVMLKKRVVKCPIYYSTADCICGRRTQRMRAQWYSGTCDHFTVYCWIDRPFLSAAAHTHTHTRRHWPYAYNIICLIERIICSVRQHRHHSQHGHTLCVQLGCSQLNETHTYWFCTDLRMKCKLNKCNSISANAWFSYSFAKSHDDTDLTMCVRPNKRSERASHPSLLCTRKLPLPIRFYYLYYVWCHVMVVDILLLLLIIHINADSSVVSENRMGFDVWIVNSRPFSNWKRAHWNSIKLVYM